MMWLVGFLTFILVVDCLLLILLVLVQLPKKEAGMGQAFGGAATDALFGAGSGNALTKMTKYATGIFFVLTLAISILFSYTAKNEKSGFQREYQKTGSALPETPTAAANAGKSAPAATNATAPPNALLTTASTNAAAASTNAAKAATNAPLVTPPPAAAPGATK